METDGHRWADLDEDERRDLESLHGDTPAEAFDERPLEHRVTLRCVRRAMAGVADGALWRSVDRLLWVSPNQIGFVVRDPQRFRDLVRTDAFRPDPGWLLLLFKHEAEWSVREAGRASWGLQLYRRGPDRNEEGEIVADLDRAPYGSGLGAHLRDVRRPSAAESHPLHAWEEISSRR